MKKFLLPALAATLLLAATAVAATLDAFKGMKGTLDIAGGTAHIPVMKEAAKRIMTANPDIRITVAGGGSGVGVQQVGEGLVQIGNTGRPLKDKEIEKFGLKTFPFAIDGVALVVNPANNVSDITAQQAADIYNGKITNWKELGGTDAPITPVYPRRRQRHPRGVRGTCAEQGLHRAVRQRGEFQRRDEDRRSAGQAVNRLRGHRACGQEREGARLRQDGPLCRKTPPRHV